MGLSEEVLRSLASLDAGPHLVTSVYLNVDGDRRPRRSDYLDALDILLKGLRARMAERALAREVKESFLGDLERVRGFADKEFQRSGSRGLAIFACSAREFFKSLALPLPVQDRAVAERRPYLAPLESMLARHQPYVATLVERGKGRVFRVRFGQVVSEETLREEIPTRHDQGGWAQKRFQRHVDEHALRHLRKVAERLLELEKEGALGRLIITGPEEARAELARLLHPWVASKLVASLPLPAGADRADILALVARDETAYMEQRGRESEGRLLAAVEQGRGVLGLERTLDALAEGRVEELVVVEGYEVPGFRCPRCQALSAYGRTCSLCGVAMEEVEDVVGSAVDQALFRGARVEPVPPGGDLEEQGSVGALLRF